jgi:hypothetical protein
MALEKETAVSRPLGVLGLFFKSATFTESEINLYSNHSYRFSEAALLRQDFVSLNMMRHHHHGANYF